MPIYKFLKITKSKKLRYIDNYYKKHILTLEKQIMLLEDKDYKISNKTSSNIDFLNKRNNE